MRKQFFSKNTGRFVLFLLLSGYAPNSLGMMGYNPATDTSRSFLSNFALLNLEEQRQQVLGNLNARIQQMTDIKAWEQMALEYRKAETRKWRIAEDAAQETCLWQTRLPIQRPDESALDCLKAVCKDVSALCETVCKIYGSGKLFVPYPLFGVDVSDIQKILEGWSYKMSVLKRYLKNALRDNPFENRNAEENALKNALSMVKCARDAVGNFNEKKIVRKIVEPLQKAQLADQWELIDWTQGCSNWREVNQKMYQNLQNAQYTPINQSSQSNHVIPLIVIGKKLLTVQRLEPDMIQWRNKMLTWRKREDAWNAKISQRTDKLLEYNYNKTLDTFALYKEKHKENWFKELIKKEKFRAENAWLVGQWEEEDQKVWDQEEWVSGQAKTLIWDLDARLQDMREGEGWINKRLEQREKAKQKWLWLENMAQDVTLWKVLAKLNPTIKNASEIQSEIWKFESIVNEFYEKGKVFSSRTYPLNFILPKLDGSYIQEALDNFVIKLKGLEIVLQKIYQEDRYEFTKPKNYDQDGVDWKKQNRKSTMRNTIGITQRIINTLQKKHLVQEILTFLSKKQENLELWEFTKGVSNWQQATERMHQQLKQNPTEECVDMGKKLLKAQEWEPDIQKWREEMLRCKRIKGTEGYWYEDRD